ncbi:MAG: transcription antitermination factor NusB [bacterium]|nr:transcription antitermination factor NusB [bacterium]
MGSRRAARELALQALYQEDMLGDDAQSGRALSLFWRHFEHENAEVQRFARELVEGVREHLAEVDALVAASSEHWKLPRLSKVDLNLLRLATWEMIGRPEIPTPVTINEAVEIARRFGSEESPAFVNGVLDQVAQQLAARRAASSEGPGGGGAE